MTRAAETDFPTADSLSIADQARLTSGRDFWTTEPVDGLPSIMLTDGPHGLRKQEGAADHLGLSGSVPATCFPPAVGLAQTWNPALAERIGAALGAEARAAGVSVVLGPGVNLKRSPLGGRNFEYFSEDPYLAGVLGTGWVRGIQGQGVGASLKHFAANNQESDRMRVSSDIDERTLHELYLRAFRRIVRDAQPWTLMCAYNRINGIYASQNRELLTTILREDWGFEGLVVSDWGAVADRVASIAAGLDLTMPSPGTDSDEAVAAAVAAGALDPAALATSAGRLIDLVARTASGREDAPAIADLDAHHALAREAAEQAIVLLRNDGDVLPLSDESGSVAVIGYFAEDLRYQGGGSSHVNATKVEAPLDELCMFAPGELVFAQGYTVDGSGDADELRESAVFHARQADSVVLFLGLGERQESEGFDRTDIELPADQLALADAVVAANPNTVVVLSHGGALRLAPLTAPAILDCGLLGQAGGSAIAATLFGKVNPSGRLAETLPVRLADTPAFLSFPGEHGHVVYGEGIHVGYRWYDARDLEVEFPFGHGLSYTEFEYRDLVVTTSDDGLTVDLTVTNLGPYDGREVVQVYVGVDGSAVARAPRELKGFASVDLGVGQSQQICLTISRDDLAYWDIRVHDFVVEDGTYRVEVGASSRDIRLTDTVGVDGDELSIPLTLESTIAEVMATPAGAQALGDLAGQMFGDAVGGDALGVDLGALLGSIPIGRLADFSGGAFPGALIQQLLDQANSAAESRRTASDSSSGVSAE
ncbi:glycoside hydrolase family 3 C-terminal domain-containing protein [Gordonia sp. NPDC003376]